MDKGPATYGTGLRVIAIAWLAAASVSCTAAESPLMSPTEAYALIRMNRGNPNFVVLDVRTPEEFMTGHIQGAVNIDVNGSRFRDAVGKLDPEKTHLVYCRTGRRSAEAVQIMRDLGFTRLLRFEGDIVRWRAENLPLATDEKPS